MTSALLFANKHTGTLVGFYTLNVFEPRQKRKGEEGRNIHTFPPVS